MNYLRSFIFHLLCVFSASSLLDAVDKDPSDPHPPERPKPRNTLSCIDFFRVIPSSRLLALPNLANAAVEIAFLLLSSFYSTII
jgi:hypothetical protein